MEVAIITPVIPVSYNINFEEFYKLRNQLPQPRARDLDKEMYICLLKRNKETATMTLAMLKNLFNYQLG